MYFTNYEYTKNMSLQRKIEQKDWDGLGTLRGHHQKGRFDYVLERYH